MLIFSIEIDMIGAKRKLKLLWIQESLIWFNNMNFLKELNRFRNVSVDKGKFGIFYERMFERTN